MPSIGRTKLLKSSADRGSNLSMTEVIDRGQPRNLLIRRPSTASGDSRGAVRPADAQAKIDAGRKRVRPARVDANPGRCARYCLVAVFGIGSALGASHLANFSVDLSRQVTLFDAWGWQTSVFANFPDASRHRSFSSIFWACVVPVVSASANNVARTIRVTSGTVAPR